MEVKRMAGSYEIIHSMMIGDKEIVLGEDPKNTDGLVFMCSFCDDNGIVVRFYDAVASDDFCEIAQEYGRRISEQAEKTRQALLSERIGPDGHGIITSSQCVGINSNDDLLGTIIVIKPEVLRREYRTATHQLKLCTGGFGASPNSRGSACFCTDLLTGKESRFERRDVLGTIEQDKLPQWAKEGLAAIQQNEKSKGVKEKGGR